MKRGFNVFLTKGRCVSCHTMEQDYALFTDNRFHNIGVGVNRIQAEIPQFAPAFLDRESRGHRCGQSRAHESESLRAGSLRRDRLAR